MENHDAEKIYKTDGAAAFLCDRFGIKDPLLALRKAVCELLSKSSFCIPVDLTAFFSQCRITLKIDEGDYGKEAVLQPNSNGFELLLSTSKKRGQGQLFKLLSPYHRYTVAHEIIETFFFMDGNYAPVHWSRLPHYRGRLGCSKRYGGNAEELLCNYGATLLLIPKSVIEELTNRGQGVPTYSVLNKTARYIEVGNLNLTHRIAAYLSVKHNEHVAVGIVQKCKKDTSNKNGTPEWRFIPSGGNNNLPVATDPASVLYHNLFLSTNKSLKKLGLDPIIAWLDEGGPIGKIPLATNGNFKSVTTSMQLMLKQASFDKKWKRAVLWFSLSFD